MTPTTDQVTDVLRTVQRRFRPVWWHRLPEGLGLAGVLTYMVHVGEGSPLAWGLFYSASFLCLLMPRFHYKARRGMSPRHSASRGAMRALTIGFIALVIAAFAAWAVPIASMPSTMLVIAGLAVMLVLTLKVADRCYHRDLPSMWADLGATPSHGEAAPPLDDPHSLQLMVALGASQEARGWALRDAVGISADEALERLRELEDFGLIKGYRRFLESRRDEDRWYRMTPVGDFALGSHLAATRQDAHA